MRPRLITAENAREAALAGARTDASMRPRLITAENEHLIGGQRVVFFASMRPRLITAENAASSSVGNRSGSVLQ